MQQFTRRDKIERLIRGTPEVVHEFMFGGVLTPVSRAVVNHLSLPQRQDMRDLSFLTYEEIDFAYSVKYEEALAMFDGVSEVTEESEEMEVVHPVVIKEEKVGMSDLETLATLSKNIMEKRKPIVVDFTPSEQVVELDVEEVAVQRSVENVPHAVDFTPGQAVCTLPFEEQVTRGQGYWEQQWKDTTGYTVSQLEVELFTTNWETVRAQAEFAIMGALEGLLGVGSATRLEVQCYIALQKGLSKNIDDFKTRIAHKLQDVARLREQALLVDVLPAVAPVLAESATSIVFCQLAQTLRNLIRTTWATPLDVNEIHKFLERQWHERGCDDMTYFTWFAGVCASVVRRPYPKGLLDCTVYLHSNDEGDFPIQLNNNMFGALVDHFRLRMPRDFMETKYYRGAKEYPIEVRSKFVAGGISMMVQNTSDYRRFLLEAVKGYSRDNGTIMCLEEMVLCMSIIPAELSCLILYSVQSRLGYRSAPHNDWEADAMQAGRTTALRPRLNYDTTFCKQGCPYGFVYNSRKEVELSPPRSGCFFFIAVPKRDDGFMRCRVTTELPSARWKSITLDRFEVDLVVGKRPRVIRDCYIPPHNKNEWTVFRFFYKKSRLNEPLFATVFDLDRIYGFVSIRDSKIRRFGETDVIKVTSAGGGKTCVCSSFSQPVDMCYYDVALGVYRDVKDISRYRRN